MMLRRYSPSANPRNLLVALIAGLGTTMAVSCASAHASTAQQQIMLKRLHFAEAQDRVNAAAGADPAEVEDSLQAAQKAERAVREIQHGFAVSPEELQTALDVPPPVITAVDRKQMIQRLLLAKQEDERRLEATFHEGPTRDSYAERADEVDEVVKELEIGEDVPWSRIQGALKIPYKP